MCEVLAMVWDLFGRHNFPDTYIFHLLGRKQHQKIKMVFHQLCFIVRSPELVLGIIFSHLQSSWFCFKQESNSAFSLTLVTCISTINICQLVPPWFSLQSITAKRFPSLLQQRYEKSFFQVSVIFGI